MACHTLGEDGQGSRDAKLVADATILNSVPGPASSGYAVFALTSGDVPSTVQLRTDFPTPDRKYKCTPALTRHQTKRPPGPRTFLRYCSASTCARSPTCRMPGIRS